MWAWLNPRNWLTVISAVKAAWSLVTSILEWYRKREQEKKLKEVEELTRKMQEADGDEKVKLACRLEKLRNPNSDCDL